MREIVKLTKLFIFSSFGLSTMMHQLKKGRKEIWKPIVFFLVFLSLIPTYILYIRFVNSIYIQLYTLGQESSIFALAIVPVSFMIFFFGIVYAMSSFYFSKDMEPLIPLPIHESKIVVAKFLSMLTYEYVIAIPFLMPIFIIGSGEFGGLMYGLYSLLTILLLPVVPLGLGTILIMFLMKYTNIQGKKDFIRNIALFLLIIVILGIQTAMTKILSSIPPGQEMQFLSEMLQNSNGLMEFVGRTYPPALWFSKSLSLASTIGGLVYMGINVLIAVFMISIIGKLGSRVYLNALLEKNHYTRSVKPLKVEKIRRKPQYFAVFLNDVRLVFRTPIYLFNCVSIAFILPILLVGMPIISGTGEDIDFGQLYLTYGEYFSFILVAAFAFVAAANPTASTTFSREGKAYWITSMIPVSPLTMFVGRILQPMLIELISIVLLLAGLKFIVPISISSMVLAFLIGILASTPIMAIGITIDALSPKLDWDEPQKAVKQNVNVIFSMLFGLAYIFLIGLLCKKMMDIHTNITLIYAFLAIQSILLLGGIYKFYEFMYNKK